MWKLWPLAFAFLFVYMLYAYGHGKKPFIQSPQSPVVWPLHDMRNA